MENKFQTKYIYCDDCSKVLARVTLEDPEEGKFESIRAGMKCSSHLDKDPSLLDMSPGV